MLLLFCSFHSSLEFASSSATMPKTLIPQDLSYSFLANLSSTHHALLVSGIPATSSGATNMKMFPLDPQIKATTSKPRNPSSSGHFSLPPPSHSSGPTSFASAETTPKPSSPMKKRRRIDSKPSKMPKSQLSESKCQRSQNFQARVTI